MKTAGAVVIGAGAGLSTPAGFVYTGERFETYFGDFAAKYGLFRCGGPCCRETFENEDSIRRRSICVNGDIGDALARIREGETQ